MSTKLVHRFGTFSSPSSDSVHLASVEGESPSAEQCIDCENRPTRCREAQQDPDFALEYVDLPPWRWIGALAEQSVPTPQFPRPRPPGRDHQVVTVDEDANLTPPSDGLVECSETLDASDHPTTVLAGPMGLVPGNEPVQDPAHRQERERAR